MSLDNTDEHGTIDQSTRYLIGGLLLLCIGLFALSLWQGFESCRGATDLLTCGAWWWIGAFLSLVGLLFVILVYGLVDRIIAMSEEK